MYKKIPAELQYQTCYNMLYKLNQLLNIRGLWMYEILGYLVFVLCHMWSKNHLNIYSNYMYH